MESNKPVGKDLVSQLYSLLAVRQCKLVGCLRQNSLIGDGEERWRMIRGNAILHALGRKVTIEYPLGIFDAFIRQDEEGTHLLTFRGGSMKKFWEDDAQMLAACVMVFSQLPIDTIKIVREEDGKIQIHTLLPEQDADHMVESALTEWDQKPVGRIYRQSTRGRIWCPHCPVASRCAAIDLEYGQTKDWPSGGQNGKL